MKRVYAIALAVALACGGLIYYVFSRQNLETEKTVQTAEQKVTAVESKLDAKVTLVVAAGDIAKDTVIGYEDLDTIEVDRGILHSIDAMTAVELAAGRQAARDIRAGEAVTAGDVKDISRVHHELSYGIEEGMYAVELPVSLDGYVAEHIAEGDRLDLLFREKEETEETGSADKEQTEGEPAEDDRQWLVLIENVRVIKLGSRTWTDEGSNEYDFLILELDRDSAMLLLNSREYGDIRAILRSSAGEDEPEDEYGYPDTEYAE